MDFNLKKYKIRISSGPNYTDIIFFNFQDPEAIHIIKNDYDSCIDFSLDENMDDIIDNMQINQIYLDDEDLNTFKTKISLYVYKLSKID